MWGNFIHWWERRLSCADKHRKSEPFEWGLEHLGLVTHGDPFETLREWSEEVLQASDHFFRPASLPDFSFSENRLVFVSPVKSLYPQNNLASARMFPSERKGPAVVVLPQWNGNAESHVTLCRILQKAGISALRLTLPYHEERNPCGGPRADYLVSASIGRTIQGICQAVQEAILCAEFLVQSGYGPIGITGSSVGSCISYLAFVHEERFEVGVFNHVSSYFGDVVWRGLSTRHVRAAIEGHLTQEQLHQAWAVLSPNNHVMRLQQMRHRPCLFISAKYDLTFPPDLSDLLFAKHDACGIPYDVAFLPCGHYTTALWPFKYIDGFRIIQYFRQHLARNLSIHPSSFTSISRSSEY